MKQTATHWISRARQSERARDYGTASVQWLAAAELTPSDSPLYPWLLTRHERAEHRAQLARKARRVAS